MNGEKRNSKKIKAFIVLAIILISAASLLFVKPNKYLFKEFNFNKLSTAKVIKQSNNNSVRMVFVGDIMLDRNVRNLIDKDGFDYYFAGIKDVVKDADIAIGNLEGPFTTSKSLTASLKNKVLQFTFDPSLATELADLGFDILGLSNNHTLNFGYKGLDMTRRYIGESGMLYYGDPNNKDEISTLILINSIKVGIVGFHEFSYMNYDKVFKEIENLRSQVDVLIVTPHWGIEYDKKPSEKQKKWARQFIDSGADIVIGTHSHIIGDIEEYNGKKIFYSLGNFAFDQFFSEETMTGMGVTIDIVKDGNAIQLNQSTIEFRVDKTGVKVSYSSNTN